MAFVPLDHSVAVRYGETPEEAGEFMVSGNFFSGLGIASARGRGFTLQEEADFGRQRHPGPTQVPRRRE
jgi:hypothetical protein